MAVAQFHTKQEGFSLLEAILAVAIFALTITVLSEGILSGNESVVGASHHSQARWYAQECLEAVHWIRDESGFSALENGQHGLATNTGQWQLSGSSETIDIFTREVTIQNYASGSKQIDCAVSYDAAGGSRNVSLTTLITSWR